ncbi:flagellar filament capping protein FliD [Georgenia subflava]|uniref:Flagellar hook-associated protein 2 n=1 Tax=Georgenia subflava TaxID=1622177 RepID=A0A6N7EJ75_9MICO|nr:flagellar filament capping protein FliD [Georgenia subflava]MPV38442.1 flagellar filament capping protein FliD [Georgenia subflava]
MSSLAIDGLISGLDTTSLINSLMQLEAAPQTLLKNKSSEASRIVNALQALNTKVASLATSATDAASAESWTKQTVTSSADSVTATAGTGAQPSTLQLKVDRLATGQVSMTNLAAPGVDLGTPPTLTVVRGGEIFTIEATGSSATEMAEAINKVKDLGLSAVAVRVGNAVDGGEPEYRLQLSGVTGESNAFEVYAGDAVANGHIDSDGNDLGSAGAARLVDSTTAAVKAQDAQITLWPDATLAEGEEYITLTSGTNSFAEVLPGVSFTVSEVAAEGDEPVTLTVERDDAASTKMVSGLINNVNLVLAEIASRTSATTSTSDDGREVVTGGILSGNSAVRGLSDQVRSAISMPVDGRSPAEVGITLERSGELTFDEEAFAAALAADPEGTQALVAAIAQRVADVADGASDPIDGTLSLQLTSQEGRVKDLGAQIAEWDNRLATRRIGLERTYAQLEVTLSQLQSQSDWLTSQLSGLPQWNTKD